MSPKTIKPTYLNPLIVVIHCSMAVLLIFAICYYKERVSFSDTSGYLTDMTRYDCFAIGHNRFVSIISQLIPVALLKAHASLKAIAVAYSLNCSLVPVGLSLFSIYWFKLPYHALAIMLMVTVMNMLLFYYPVSELQMGLCLLLFYDAAADYRQKTKGWTLFIVLTLLLVPFITFSHPTILFVFLSWVIYRLLLNTNDYRSVLCAAACFLLSYIIKKVWFTTDYEAAKMISDQRLQDFTVEYYQLPLAKSIYQYLEGEAFMVVVVLVITVAILVWLKKFKLIIFELGVIFSFFTILLIKFEDGWSATYYHYFEHLLQPIIFFLVLIFAYAFSRLPINQSWKAGFLVVVFTISFAKIHNRRDWHLSREKWIYSYLDLMDNLQVKKAIAGRNWIPEGLDKGSFWSVNWESLILSSLDGPANSKALFLAWDITQVREPVYETDQFISDSYAIPQSSLPREYYHLGNSSYVYLENLVPDSVLNRLRNQ